MVKIKTVDIETANLDADFGFVFCITVKELGEKARTYSLLSHPGKPWYNDKNLLKAAAKDLNDTGAFVTWYGIGFDVPFLNARLIKHGLPPIPTTIAHLDLWKTCRNYLKLSRNGLANFVSFMGLAEKQFVPNEVWVAARCGDKKAIKEIVTRCDSDVAITEKAYYKLLPLIANHPNINQWKEEHTTDNCSKCGSVELKKEGWKYTKMYRRRMFSCKACNSWLTGPLERRTDIKVA